MDRHSFAFKKLVEDLPSSSNLRFAGVRTVEITNLLRGEGQPLPEKNQNFTIGGKTEKKERVKNDRKTVETID
jgi:hypothetical protein